MIVSYRNKTRTEFPEYNISSEKDCLNVVKEMWITPDEHINLYKLEKLWIILKTY